MQSISVRYLQFCLILFVNRDKAMVQAESFRSARKATIVGTMTLVEVECTYDAY